MWALRTSSVSISLILTGITPLVHANLWTVNIDESPAPSPEDGPPFSAHASRNHALLPAQICEIVGAYVACVLIVCSLLLTVARRRRREAQIVRMGAVEMVAPTVAFGASPISPKSPNSWYSPRKLQKKMSAPSSTKSVTSLVSPGLDSNASFDLGILEANKAARERELENLYAAALAQEDAKSQITITEGPLSPPIQDEIGISLQQVPSPQQLPRLSTSSRSLARLRPTPSDAATIASPRSPVRAIYPPDSPIPMYPPSPALPSSPLSTQHFHYSQAGYRSPTPPSKPPAAPSLASTIDGPRSIDSWDSNHRGQRKAKKQPRHLDIKTSLQSTHHTPTHDQQRQQGVQAVPLTPRYHNEASVYPEAMTGSDGPTTSAMHERWSHQSSKVDSLERRGETHDGDEYAEAFGEPESRIDQKRDLPPYAPQRKMSDYRQHHNNTSTSSASNATASTLTGALPFRTMAAAQHQQHPQQPPLQHHQHQHLHPYQHHAQQPANPASPPPTKTTYLSLQSRHNHPSATLNRNRQLQPHHQLAAIRTGNTTPFTPFTPRTPYTPYMPFTPITPVTPRLLNRAERRAAERERAERARIGGGGFGVVDEEEGAIGGIGGGGGGGNSGRRMGGRSGVGGGGGGGARIRMTVGAAVVEEEDGVLDEEEMWGVAY